MNHPKPVYIVMVSKDGRPVETTLETVFWIWRRTRVRDALEREGVPLWAQPAEPKDCIKMLAGKWGLLQGQP